VTRERYLEIKAIIDLVFIFVMIGIGIYFFATVTICRMPC
jgi:hypothetical protein